MRRERHFDAIVIGAGTAGLTAATWLAQAGARVCVLAKGVGSTHLAPGTVDVLGYVGDERVDSPRAGLPRLPEEHPYGLVGPDGVERALSWLTSVVASGPLPGYGYLGSLEENLLLPTALGVLRPSALVPETMAPGASRDGPGVCVVGVRALRDFQASLCAGNLERAGVRARSVELDPELDRVEANALGLARRFDDPGWRAGFCAELAGRLRGEERVGLPAVLGLSDPHRVWDDVQRRLGRAVFEIPTLPPSVPGMRLFEILRSALTRAGGRLVLGSEVVGCERGGERVEAVRAHAAGGERTYRADWFVLATGGVASGAIEMDSRWQWAERVLGVELTGLPAAGEPRFADRYLDEQPVARVGVAVERDLRAAGRENVVVAGAALPGAIPWREGSGEGIALATGLRAAEVVLGAAPAQQEVGAA